MEFVMVHSCSGKKTSFTVETAPLWLTSEGTIKGSTMDYRWFWELVKTLGVGESIDSDFHTITKVSNSAKAEGLS